MRTRRFNDEVDYPDERVVRVCRSDIASLKAKAGRNQRCRSRLCTHQEVDDSLHEMLIVHSRGVYVRPHKHVSRSESFHIIDGEVDVVLFDESGDISDVIRMSDYSSGLPFYYRIGDEQFHSLLIRSNEVVFHETTNGPFRRENTIFASWAPEESEVAEVEEFFDYLQESVACYLDHSHVGCAV